MKQNKTLKNYVSDIDQFLLAFDKKHPQPSLSQQKEQKKYQRIGFLRDTADRPFLSKKDPEGF